MTRRLVPLVAAIAMSMTLVIGCSDDVVCPEPGPDALPHISASVVQGSDGRVEWTYAEVVCSADPLPSQFITSINGRDLIVADPSGDLGLVANFDDDVIVWQPGVPCELDVTTNYGYATAGVVVPDAPAVDAPAVIALGDPLTIVWSKATGADYYRLTATYAENEGGVTRGARNTLAFVMTTRDTAATLITDGFTLPGEFLGVVESVAGPFPEGGTEGNVSGVGWGFFTLHYSDSGSVFDVAVSDAGNR
jgi:hypothetical protein